MLLSLQRRRLAGRLVRERLVERRDPVVLRRVRSGVVDLVAARDDDDHEPDQRHDEQADRPAASRPSCSSSCRAAPG